MPKNQVVYLAAYRKKRLPHNTEAPALANTPACSLCRNEADGDNSASRCFECRKTQQAVLQAYGLLDYADENCCR